MAAVDGPEVQRARPWRVRGLRALAVVALLGGLLGWYRLSGPMIDAGGFGVGVPTHVGEPVHVGIPLRTDGGVIEVRDLELLEAIDGVTVAFAVSDRPVGALRGDLESTHALGPARGSEVSGDEADLPLVVSITPTREGVYRFDGIRITHGSGLRRHDQRVDLDICVVAMAEGVDLPQASSRCGRSAT